MVSLTRSAGFIGCPVEGYEGWKMTRTNIRIHFVHCHMWDTIVIMEEGKCPHPH